MAEPILPAVRRLSRELLLTRLGAPLVAAALLGLGWWKLDLPRVGLLGFALALGVFCYFGIGLLRLRELLRDGSEVRLELRGDQLVLPPPPPAAVTRAPAPYRGGVPLVLPRERTWPLQQEPERLLRDHEGRVVALLLPASDGRPLCISHDLAELELAPDEAMAVQRRAAIPLPRDRA